MPVSVVSPRSLTGFARPLSTLVCAALALEGRRPGEVAVVLAGDATLRDLNRRWRGLDRATDVLSFGYDDGQGEVADGDIVVSLERACAQARRFRVTEGRELARLVVHGALHLAGLDHQSAAQRRRMRTREERVLQGAREEIAALDGALESRSGRGAG
jgi:probable rRNA maturation factor